MNTSKNVGELSSLTFLLQGIEGNYEPEHSQNTSGYKPNYNSAQSCLKGHYHRETITLIYKSN